MPIQIRIFIIIRNICSDITIDRIILFIIIVYLNTLNECSKNIFYLNSLRHYPNKK